MWTAVEPHGSENYDQTASHGSLLPFESEPKKKKKKLRRRRWQSRGCVKLKQQVSNLAQIANHSLHLRLLLLFLFLSYFSPSSLSSFRGDCCGFSPSLCLGWFWIPFFFFMFPMALVHVTWLGRIQSPSYTCLGIENRVFWVNIAKSKPNLRYRNCWNLFGILRRETEFRYYHCRNSTKSMREKKKKVERKNVEFRQHRYRNSSAQFYCPGVRGVRGVPKVKRKKKICDKLIVAMALPK